MFQYDAFQDEIFKIVDRGYPRRIKLCKFYTLTFFFDGDGKLNRLAVKENPNSPLLGKDK